MLVVFGKFMFGVFGIFGGVVWILVKYFVIVYIIFIIKEYYLLCKDYLVCLNSFKMYKIIFFICLKMFRSF